MRYGYAACVYVFMFTVLAALYAEHMWTILGTFRSEYEIEYEDGFQISIQLPEPSPLPIADQLKRRLDMRLVWNVIIESISTRCKQSYSYSISCSCSDFMISISSTSVRILSAFLRLPNLLCRHFFGSSRTPPHRSPRRSAWRTKRSSLLYQSVRKGALLVTEMLSLYWVLVSCGDLS